MCVCVWLFFVCGGVLGYFFKVILSSLSQLQFGIWGHDYLESHDLHAQDLGIKHSGVFDAPYCHHNVVKSVDKTRRRALPAVPP